jgi:hypothetical protein
MSLQAARLAAVQSVVYHDWDSKPDYDAIPQSIIDRGMQVADEIGMVANGGYLTGAMLPSNPQNMYASHAHILDGPYAPFVGATDKEFIEEYGPDFIHVPAHLIASLQPRMIDAHRQPLGVDLPTNPAARATAIDSRQRDPGVAGAPLKGPFAPSSVPQAESSQGKALRTQPTEQCDWLALAGAALILCAVYYSQ